VGSNARLSDTLAQSAEQIGALQEDLRWAPYDDDYDAENGSKV
jgi:hypothetical protein